MCTRQGAAACPNSVPARKSDGGWRRLAQSRSHGCAGWYLETFLARFFGETFIFWSSRGSWVHTLVSGSNLRGFLFAGLNPSENPMGSRGSGLGLLPACPWKCPSSDAVPAISGASIRQCLPWPIIQALVLFTEWLYRAACVQREKA